MLTYSGEFDKEKMISAAKPYIRMHINKNDPSECEVPFTSSDRKVNGYIQFAFLAGNWVFVAMKVWG